MSELAAATPVGILAKAARRVAVALTISIGMGLLMLPVWKHSPSSFFLRTILLGLSATSAFALFEFWPPRLPRWLQRWVLQVVAVGVSMPITTLLIYALTTPRGAPPFWAVRDRMHDFILLTFLAILLAPWTALAAIVRQNGGQRCGASSRSSGPSSRSWQRPGTGGRWCGCSTSGIRTSVSSTCTCRVSPASMPRTTSAAARISCSSPRTITTRSGPSRRARSITS